MKRIIRIIYHWLCSEWLTDRIEREKAHPRRGSYRRIGELIKQRGRHCMILDELQGRLV